MKQHLEKVYGGIQSMEAALGRLAQIGHEFPELQNKLNDLRAELKGEMNPESFRKIAVELAELSKKLEVALRAHTDQKHDS